MTLVIVEGTARTALVAPVTGFVIVTGCPAAGHGGRCNGPPAVSSERAILCPGCYRTVTTTDTDDHDIWRVVDRSRR